FFDDDGHAILQDEARGAAGLLLLDDDRGGGNLHRLNRRRVGSRRRHAGPRPPALRGGERSHDERDDGHPCEKWFQTTHQITPSLTATENDRCAIHAASAWPGSAGKLPAGVQRVTDGGRAALRGNFAR